MPNHAVALATVAEEMAKLRSAYLERLRAALDELQAIAAGLTGNDTDRPHIEILQQRLHKLAGSGGTFGLPELSERARDLEKQAQRWLEQSVDHIDDESRRRFVAELATLSESLGETLNQEPMTSAISDQAKTSERREYDRSMHVWLVEDDELLGQELIRLMEPFGFEVRLFTKITEAEAAIQAQRPDILIMDVLFPHEGEDSTEVLSIRPDLRALGCPLIFISSQGDIESRVRAARLGAEGYMLKPLDVPRLVERVEGLLDRRQAPPQRVLIVDDDLDLAAHYRLVLRGAGMEAEIVKNPDKVMEHLSAFRPELVLMDMNMPAYSGSDLAGVIRQHDNWLSLPIVYLSAETDFDKQLQALDRGADDFLTKPISDAQLVAAVRARISRFRQLSDQITKDSLTGLLKHASIKEYAEVEIIRARRTGKPVSLAMIDIDHFKKVNDTYGHAVGDIVIKSLATLLRQRLRQSDQIGRYGGEEFVVVLPECNAEAARLVLDDIRSRFANLQFRHEGQTFACTLSAGVTSSSQYPAANSAELLVKADQALYIAKQGGRNRVCWITA